MECEQYKYKRIDCSALKKLIYMPCSSVGGGMASYPEDAPGAANWTSSVQKTICKLHALCGGHPPSTFQPTDTDVYVQFNFKQQVEYHYSHIKLRFWATPKEYCYYLGKYPFNWLFPTWSRGTAGASYSKLIKIPNAWPPPRTATGKLKEDVQKSVRLTRSGRPEIPNVDYFEMMSPEAIKTAYTDQEQWIIKEWRDRWNKYEMAHKACVEKYENLGRPARIIATGAEGEVVDIYHRGAMETFLIYKIFKSRFEVWHVKKKDFEYTD